jgi:hypothetical protein
MRNTIALIEFGLGSVRGNEKMDGKEIYLIEGQRWFIKVHQLTMI